MGIGVVVITGGNSHKHGKKGTHCCVPFGFVVLWQAYHSPASLGSSSCLYRRRVVGTEATASKHCQAVFAVADYWELLGSSFRIVTEAAPERAVVSLLKVRVKEVWVGA